MPRAPPLTTTTSPGARPPPRPHLSGAAMACSSMTVRPWRERPTSLGPRLTTPRRSPWLRRRARRTPHRIDRLAIDDAHSRPAVLASPARPPEIGLISAPARKGQTIHRPDTVTAPPPRSADSSRRGAGRPHRSKRAHGQTTIGRFSRASRIKPHRRSAGDGVSTLSIWMTVALNPRPPACPPVPGPAVNHRR